MEMFDVSHGRFKKAPPMRSDRCAATAAVVGAKLYVCGGDDGSRTLRNVERFDPSVGVWEETLGMTVARSDASAVATGGRIYIFGGYCEYGANQVERLSSVACFDPARGEWATLPSMPERRAGLAAVVL